MSKIILKKEKKRNDLLNAAYDLFTTIGFSKTTILNIALRAGVGKGTFYLYFDSKEEIRDALIIQKSSELLLSAMTSLDDHCRYEEERHREMVMSGNEAEEAFEPMSVSDKIIFITDYILNALSKNIALLQFISKNLSWGMFSESSIIGKGDDSMLDFRSYVTGLMERDGVRLEQPDLLLFTIIELINSTCYNVILHGEPVTFSDYKPYLYNTIRVLVNRSVL